MSKTETVKALRDTRTDSQIELLRALREVQTEMQSLPEAMASELTQRLEPLEKALQAHRQSMDAVIREMAAASRALEGIRKEQLPRHLRQASVSLDRAAQRQPGPGTRILELMLAAMMGSAIMGGVLLLVGILVFGGLQPPASGPPPAQVIVQ